MSDIRLSMREFRFLEEKRKLAPLTQAEEQRWVELGQTLGIFELPNADEVVEADPSDVILVEPGPDQADEVAGQEDAPVMLTQNFEWVAPYQTPSAAIPLEPDPSETQVTAAADPLPVSETAEVQHQAELPPMSEETPSPFPVAEPSAFAQAAADEGDTWNGPAPSEAEATMSPSDSTEAAPSSVIDLMPADATPSSGIRMLPDAEPLHPAPPLDLPPTADPSASDPANPLANDLVEGWGIAAAQAFPTTAPQYRNPINPPSTFVEGERRVVVHLLDGQVRRGTVKDLNLMSGTVPLLSAGGVENISVDRLKAIFFLLEPGAAKPATTGQKVRLTFQDGRQVVGFSADYQTGDPGFFLIPAELKTNTERIFVFNWSVYSIAEE